MTTPGYASEKCPQGDLPVVSPVIRPEVRFRVVEPVTGAEVSLGHYWRGKEWVEVTLTRESSPHTGFPGETYRLRNSENLTSFDRSLSEAEANRLVDQAIDRCLELAESIVVGRFPAIRHAIDVRFRKGRIGRVEIGENVPWGVTHLRRAGTSAWVPVTAFLR